MVQRAERVCGTEVPLLGLGTKPRYTYRVWATRQKLNNLSQIDIVYM